MLVALSCICFIYKRYYIRGARSRAVASVSAEDSQSADAGVHVSWIHCMGGCKISFLEHCHTVACTCSWRLGASQPATYFELGPTAFHYLQAAFLLRNDGLFVGSSAAMNCVGAVKLARKLGPGHTIGTILCDGGHRYV